MTNDFTADKVADLLRSILEEQKRTNQLMDKLVNLSSTYFAGMAGHFYTVGGQEALGVTFITTD